MKLQAAFLANNVQLVDGRFNIIGADFLSTLRPTELPTGKDIGVYLVVVADIGGDDVGNEVAIMMETCDTHGSSLDGARFAAAVPAYGRLICLGPVITSDLGIGYFTFRLWLETRPDEVVVVPLQIRPTA